MTEGIAGTLKLSGTTRAIALDISKAFDRVWHNGLLHKLRAYGVTDGIFQILPFLVVQRLKLILDGKSSPEFDVNDGVPQGSIYCPILLSFFYLLNDLPDIVLSKITIYADDITALYCVAVTRHLICGSKLKFLPVLNLILGTLWNGVIDG